MQLFDKNRLKFISGIIIGVLSLMPSLSLAMAQLPMLKEAVVWPMQQLKQKLTSIIRKQGVQKQQVLLHTVQPTSAPVATFQSAGLWQALRQHLSLDDSTNQAAVQRQLHWYVNHPAVVNKMLQNAKPYIAYVYQQVQQRGMPAEFALLPMVESGYNPYAYSHTGASGLWQMMPTMATVYGLKINWWYDSRRDVLTSTKGALDYLQRLHHSFGSWYLAAAAYDTGSGNVSKAMRSNHARGMSTSYWDLPLAAEAKHYVPKLLALAEIIKQPSLYGFQLPEISTQPSFTAVKVASQLDLSEISHLSGASIAQLQRLNPGLRRFATEPQTHYTLLLPANDAQAFRQRLAQLAGKQHITWQYHEVRKGENLAKIASNYHTSLAMLQHVNGMQGDAVMRYQGVLVPLHLHKKFQTPIVLADNTESQSSPHISSSQLQLMGTQLAANTLQAPSMAQPAASAQLVLMSQPIEKNESLKSLVQRLYGTD